MGCAAVCQIGPSQCFSIHRHSHNKKAEYEEHAAANKTVRIRHSVGIDIDLRFRCCVLVKQMERNDDRELSLSLVVSNGIRYK